MVGLHDTEEYFEHPYFRARRDADAQARARFARVKEAVREHAGHTAAAEGRFLDVGCDTGAFMEAARSQGASVVHGVEIAKRAAQIASARGFSVHVGDIATAPETFTDFSLVTALDVIEHTSEPTEFLGAVARRLSPAGLVYLETPNWTSAVYRWGVAAARVLGGHPAQVFKRLFPAQHVQYFTPLGIRKLAEQIGFEVIYLHSRPLPSTAVAGVPLQAALWLSQTPDRVLRSGILMEVLLRHARSSK